MDSPISDIIQEIKRQLSEKRVQKQQAKTQFDQIADECVRMEKALLALESPPDSEAPVMSIKPEGPRGGKPCVTKQEVIHLMSELLTSNGSLGAEDLDGLIRSRIKEEGTRSLSGFGLRMREALRDRRFSNHDGLVSMTKETEFASPSLRTSSVMTG